jgi:RNA polymerase sigma factor (sigma-70 family)
MKEYSREEESALFAAAQAGDEESTSELMRRHAGLVHAVVRRQWSGGWSYADIVQEGQIGLWQAIQKYDPGRGVRFSTYAWVAIARRVWEEVERRAESEGWGLLEEEAEPVEWQSQEIARRIGQVLQGMVASLPAREAWVIRGYYGLAGWECSSASALAKRLGCTRQGVHYHLNKALRRLRHPGWSAVLRGLLEYNRRSDYRAGLRGKGRGR